MAFDYNDVLGPIDLQGDSEAIRNYKAGTGALAAELRHAGWSEEQISNGLRTHFESISMVLVEHIMEHFIKDRRGANTVSPWTVAQEVSAEIHPRSNPCGRDYCTTCYPRRGTK